MNQNCSYGQAAIDSLHTCAGRARAAIHKAEQTHNHILAVRVLEQPHERLVELVGQRATVAALQALIGETREQLDQRGLERRKGNVARVRAVREEREHDGGAGLDEVCSE